MGQDEKKKKLSGAETVHDDGGQMAAILRGEKSLREQQPTPEDGLPGLLVSLRQQLEQSDAANAALTAGQSDALRRASELLRQLDLERGNVTVRERRLRKKRRIIKIMSDLLGELGWAFEYWEQPAVCLVRNQRAAEITGLQAVLFRNHRSIEEVLDAIGQVRDARGEIVKPEDTPLARAFRGETIESLLNYVNGVLIDGRAVPVFDEESGRVDAWILYREAVDHGA